MSDTTEYREGSHIEFIQFLFGREPTPPNTIVLESEPNDSTKNRGLHIFEQLLMVFVDGLRFFHGEDEGGPGCLNKERSGKVNVNTLSQGDIHLIQRYFHSMNYEANVEIFDTVNEYKFRYPNYFKYQDKITNACVLKDFFYEIYGENNRVFRVSFDNR